MFKYPHNNIVHISDLHLGTGYKTRRGNFIRDQYKKVKWILNFCIKHDAVLTIGGDVFDSSRAGQYEMAILYSKLFMKMAVPVFFVAGQHDLRYHRFDTFKNTPTAMLAAFLPNVVLLEDEPVQVHKVHVYGRSWGEEYPEIQDETVKNVLVFHETVGKIHKGQHGSLGSNFWFKNFDFDLFLAGDNHKTFDVKKKGKALINPGSVMRLKSDQADHEPCLFLINGASLQYKKVKIPISDVEFVIKEDLTADIDDSFIQTVKDTTLNKVDFVSFLKHNIPEGLDDEVNSILQRLQ